MAYNGPPPCRLCNCSMAHPTPWGYRDSSICRACENGTTVNRDPHAGRAGELPPDRSFYDVYDVAALDQHTITSAVGVADEANRRWRFRVEAAAAVVDCERDVSVAEDIEDGTNPGYLRRAMWKQRCAAFFIVLAVAGLLSSLFESDLPMLMPAAMLLAIILID